MFQSITVDSTESVPTQLLNRARRAQDTFALSDLLEFYRPMLERLTQRKLARILNGKVSPSEVTQVAIISASQNFGDFRGETMEQFRGWLCTILEHALTDQTRRFLASCRDSNRETRLSKDLEATSLQSPSQICSAQEQVLRLLQIVEEMPPELRTIVRMRYQQDLTFTDIAANLGLSAASVRRRWMLAIEHIERAMA